MRMEGECMHTWAGSQATPFAGTRMHFTAWLYAHSNAMHGCMPSCVSSMNTYAMLHGMHASLAADSRDVRIVTVTP